MWVEWKSIQRRTTSNGKHFLRNSTDNEISGQVEGREEHEKPHSNQNEPLCPANMKREVTSSGDSNTPYTRDILDFKIKKLCILMAGRSTRIIAQGLIANGSIGWKDSIYQIKVNMHPTIPTGIILIRKRRGKNMIVQTKVVHAIPWWTMCSIS